MADLIKIAIVDDNDIIREMIHDTLADEEDFTIVGEASDGESAVELIKADRPDVVLLDLVMPKLDGMGVMMRIRNSQDMENYHPEYIVLSAAGREDIVSEALNNGATYFMMKPFDGEALIKRIRHIRTGAGQENDAAGREDEAKSLDLEISELLRSIGMPIKMVGYKYLRDAIEKAVGEPDGDLSITKTIYPAVAEEYGTSSTNVERNIRYIIAATWERNDNIEVPFLPNKKDKPTNSEFILGCAEHIRLKSLK